MFYNILKGKWRFIQMPRYIMFLWLGTSNPTRKFFRVYYPKFVLGITELEKNTYSDGVLMELFIFYSQFDKILSWINRKFNEMYATLQPIN